MMKVFINKETKEVTRKYHIESMFDGIKPNELEEEIITEQELSAFKAYRYDTTTGLFVEIEDEHTSD